MRDRRHGERGEVVTEVVLVVPVLLFTILLIIQAGLWYHAQHVVQAAAQEGVRAARGEGTDADDGVRRAERFLVSAGSVVEGVDVGAERTSDAATVEVSGRVVAVIPGLDITVRATASSPAEDFRPASEP